MKDAGMIELSKPSLIKANNYTIEEKLSNQLDIFGFYLNNHPTNKYKTEKDIDTKKIPKYYDKNISLVVIIDNIKEIITKKNDIMAFVTASDEFGKTSLTLFPRTYHQYNNIKKKDIIKVYGHIEKRYDQYQVIVNNIKILESNKN